MGSYYSLKTRKNAFIKALKETIRLTNIFPCCEVVFGGIKNIFKAYRLNGIVTSKKSIKLNPKVILSIVKVVLCQNLNHINFIIFSSMNTLDLHFSLKAFSNVFNARKTN